MNKTNLLLCTLLVVVLFCNGCSSIPTLPDDLKEEDIQDGLAFALLGFYNKTVLDFLGKSSGNEIILVVDPQLSINNGPTSVCLEDRTKEFKLHDDFVCKLLELLQDKNACETWWNQYKTTKSGRIICEKWKDKQLPFLDKPQYFTSIIDKYSVNIDDFLDKKQNKVFMLEVSLNQVSEQNDKHSSKDKFSFNVVLVNNKKESQSVMFQDFMHDWNRSLF